MKKTIALVLCLILMATVAVGCKTQEPEKIIPERGSWSGRVYTNEYAGLKITLPQEWTYADDAGLAAMSGIGAGEMAEAGKAYTDEMLAKRTVYEFSGFSEEGTDSIIVLLDNMDFVENGANVTEEVYFEAIKLKLEEMLDGFDPDALDASVDKTDNSDDDDLDNDNLDNDDGDDDEREQEFDVTQIAVSDIYEVTISGHTYKAMEVQDLVSGVQQFYFVRKVDNYIIQIVINVAVYGSADHVLAFFS